MPAKSTSRQSSVKGSRKPTPKRPVVEPVGVAEIAAHLDVAADTVQNWRVRFPDDFPEPRGTIGSNPWWHLGDVVRWAKKHGRL